MLAEGASVAASHLARSSSPTHEGGDCGARRRVPAKRVDRLPAGAVDPDADSLPTAERDGELDSGSHAGGIGPAGARDVHGGAMVG